MLLRMVSRSLEAAKLRRVAHEPPKSAPNPRAVPCFKNALRFIPLRSETIGNLRLASGRHCLPHCRNFLGDFHVRSEDLLIGPNLPINILRDPVDVRQRSEE